MFTVGIRPHHRGRQRSPKLTVQWETSLDGIDFTPIKGATSPTYTFTPTAAMDGTFYAPVFTNAVGQAFTMSDQLTVNYVPTISLQPINQSLSPATPQPSPLSRPANRPPRCNGMRRPRGPAPSPSWTTPPIPAPVNGLTLTPASTDNGDQFKAVFTNMIGAVTKTATTTVATLAVDVAPSIQPRCPPPVR